MHCPLPDLLSQPLSLAPPVLSFQGVWFGSTVHAYQCFLLSRLRTWSPCMALHSLNQPCQPTTATPSSVSKLSPRQCNPHCPSAPHLHGSPRYSNAETSHPRSLTSLIHVRRAILNGRVNLLASKSIRCTGGLWGFEGGLASILVMARLTAVGKGRQLGRQ